MRPFDIAAVAAVLVAFPITPAAAQSETPIAPAERACPPGAGSANSKPGETTGAPSLSEKLAESKGVICPPAGVDPGISAPEKPGGGRMPVIPPPGTPGGDPHIQPK